MWTSNLERKEPSRVDLTIELKMSVHMNLSQQDVNELIDYFNKLNRMCRVDTWSNPETKSFVRELSLSLPEALMKLDQALPRLD